MLNFIFRRNRKKIPSSPFRNKFTSKFANRGAETSIQTSPEYANGRRGVALRKGGGEREKKFLRASWPTLFYHQSGSTPPPPVLAGRDVQKSLSPGRWAVDKVNHGLIYDVELPFPYTSAGRSVFGSFVGRHLGRHVSCIVERML